VENMFNLVLEKLEKLGENVEYKVKGSEIKVVVLDFIGYNDEWGDVYNDYDEDAVEEFEEWLEEHCVSCQCDYYQYYEFDGFNVEIGYSSMDI
jgi:hypothetical protein